MVDTSGRFTKLKGSSLGFTLIEIMIVIAVVGILAMVTVPKYQALTDHYHLESSAQIVAKQLRNAKQYAMDRRTYVYVMFNSTTVQLFYADANQNCISLDNQQIFDSGIFIVQSQEINYDIPPEVNNIPPYVKCLIFDRKGFIKESPFNIVLSNSRTPRQSVSVDLTSDSLAVKINWN